jgi:N-hydroxyarylamine O-acetyltransferase
MTDSALPLDLDAYLTRIGYTGDRQPTLDVLNALHLAHATHIPFENLDILRGRPIRLDLTSLQAKLVAGRRGGYCFEHNLLFRAVLEALGFAVRPLAARVRLGHPSVRARTHMLLMVTVADVPFIADVGFGGGGLLHPIPLVEAEPVRHYAWDFRLVREGSGWVLQSFTDAQWMDLYTFTLERQYRIDYEVANYYVSTHPDAQFTQGLFVQQATPEARYFLHDHTLTVDRGPEGETALTLADNAERLAVLAETFDLHFSPGTTFDHRPTPSLPMKRTAYDDDLP